jgi:hypothetical protein
MKEEKNRINLALTKKGLMIYIAIIVILDCFSTFMVARQDLNVFLQFEVNPFMVWAFQTFGYIAFAVYPIIPIVLYFCMVSFGFWLYERKKVMKGYFYFLLCFLNVHLFVLINNILLYYTLSCK